MTPRVYQLPEPLTIDALRALAKSLLEERDTRNDHDKLSSLQEQVATNRKIIDLFIEFHRETHRTEGVARELAVTELKLHLESLNGNQRLMQQERSDFVRREWFEVQHADLTKRMSTMELMDRQQMGRGEPIRDIVRWAAQIGGSLLILGVGWAFGHFVMR